MIAVLFTDGGMEFQDLQECHEKKWVPVLVYRRPGNPATIVPVFRTEELVRRFIKRNLSDKKWLMGAVHLGDEGISYIERQGWIIEQTDYPKLLSRDAIGYEVVEFESKPAIHTGKAIT